MTMTRFYPALYFAPMFSPVVPLAAVIALAVLLSGCASTSSSSEPATSPRASTRPAVVAAPAQAALPPIKEKAVPLPERAQLHVELAAAYYGRGQMDVALVELAEAVKLDSTNPQIYNVYGLVYSYLTDYRKSEANFQQALSMAPNDPEIRQNWGWYLCTHGRAKESIEQFEIALRDPLFKTPTIALTNAGKCSVTLQDLPAAEEYFRRALIATPNSPEPAYMLSLVLYRQQRAKEAKQWLLPVMAQELPSPQAFYLGVCVERALGDKPAEVAYSAQLRTRYPEAAETRALTGGAC